MSRDEDLSAGFADSWRKHRDQGRAERESLDAVRRVARGKARDELRDLLNSERQRRGLEPMTGLRLEDWVDAAQEPHWRLGGAKATARVASTLFRFGKEAVNAYQQFSRGETPAGGLFDGEHDDLSVRIDTDRSHTVRIPLSRPAPVS